MLNLSIGSSWQRTVMYLSLFSVYLPFSPLANNMYIFLNWLHKKHKEIINVSKAVLLLPAYFWLCSSGFLEVNSAN